MKRKVVLLITVVLFLTGCHKDYEPIHLMNFEDYAVITKKNIKKLEIVKETIDGSESEILDKEETQSVYKDLQKKVIGPRTNLSCDDNITTYIFTLKDDTQVELKIECDTVEIGENRYYLSNE